MTSKQTKKLRLTVEVPGIWADDLDDSAAIIKEGFDDATDASARREVVTEEWMEPDVVLTVLTIPVGTDDVARLVAWDAVIVAAETVPLGPGEAVTLP